MDHTLIYYVQNGLIGLSILALIYWNLYQRPDGQQRSHQLYMALLMVNGMLLVLEILLNIHTGKTTELSRVVLPLIVVLLYLLNPLPGALWVLYLDNLIENNQKPRGKLVFAVAIPVLLNALLAVLSLTGDVTFAIDSNNVYQRGRYFLFMPLICYGIFVFSFIYLLKKRKKILRHRFSSLVFFGIPPLMGGLLQSLVYGVSLVWVGLSFSLLLAYINVQREEAFTDHLTLLANRRKFDSTLAFLAAKEGKKRTLGGIMIDLNNFKQTNDQYGHQMGDRVLVDVAELLRSSLRRGDLIVRLGGDEFAVIMELKKQEDLLSAVKRLEENIRIFNQKNQYPFALSLSMGYGIYDPKSTMKQEDFIEQIDQRMYQAKQLFKQQKQSESVDKHNPT